MKHLAFILTICALGAIVFSASKVLWGGNPLFSWGIFTCATGFIITLFLFLFKLAGREDGIK